MSNEANDSNGNGETMFDIGKAQIGDIELIMEIEESCFDVREQWSQQSWTNEFFAGDRQILVAHTGDGGLLGVITVQLVGATADLHRVAVASGSRRLGAAAALINSSIAGVRHRGGDQMILEVAEDNHAAISLYTKLGFAEINRRANYYGDVDAIVMSKSLGF